MKETGGGGDWLLESAAATATAWNNKIGFSHDLLVLYLLLTGNVETNVIITADSHELAQRDAYNIHVRTEIIIPEGHYERKHASHKFGFYIARLVTRSRRAKRSITTSMLWRAN